MEQAAGHPAFHSRPLPPVARPRGGSLRSGGQSALAALLLVSGLGLWWQPQDTVILWLHLWAGLALAVLLGPWLWRHVPQGLAHSQRARFAQSSWALLAVWLVLAVSGLAMALPALLWLAGGLWFPSRTVASALSWLHFWASWPAMAGLAGHLAMRHWVMAR